MYANPSSATAMPSGPLGSAIRSTVPLPGGTGRSAAIGPVSVGEEQPTASIMPIATTVREVASRIMEPFWVRCACSIARRGKRAASDGAQYVIIQSSGVRPLLLRLRGGVDRRVGYRYIRLDWRR